ncbi:winged helix-turn-helix domain-containing protein [Pseudoxanthobacter sp. M-2]|uniref:ArsR/SmtB family transcription factor n=1 Tax=Pseudoxanthobacter sp. M-2 TaxID=3078754 RepID=UPI0038FBF133
MKDGPVIAAVAALLGDPARANMLTALMDGRALTASELAGEAGVGLPTASGHLSKLEAGGLVAVEKQGRHRYFRLSGSDVAAVLEGLMGLADRTGAVRTRPGPKEPALRVARLCYDHLAGERGVALLDGLRRRGVLAEHDGELAPTPAGRAFLRDFGIDLAPLAGKRRPLCRACLDWSERRHHLAGSLGAALLTRMAELSWLKVGETGRIVAFTPAGERAFAATFAAESPDP